MRITLVSLLTGAELQARPFAEFLQSVGISEQLILYWNTANKGWSLFTWWQKVKLSLSKLDVAFNSTGLEHISSKMNWGRWPQAQPTGSQTTELLAPVIPTNYGISTINLIFSFIIPNFMEIFLNVDVVLITLFMLLLDGKSQFLLAFIGTLQCRKETIRKGRTSACPHWVPSTYTERSALRATRGHSNAIFHESTKGTSWEKGVRSKRIWDMALKNKVYYSRSPIYMTEQEGWITK